MRLAKTGMMSYTELKGLEIKEFFIILVNYEKQVEDGGRSTKDTQ